ncbi:MAG TPA: hypothetical protein VK995_02290, partial [Oceanipulchritudo sp.]|nr:hypothetical protein [Oceanipulchritudo sp.]
GRTTGPLFSMVIQDSFGQRGLGPVMDELRELAPLMSNPADGLEEIVLGPHYWKRMTERNLSGLPTGQPSPDFWQGRIEDLIHDTGQWQSLEATAISANGRIAGTTWTFNPITAAFEQHGFLLVSSALLTDWNRDGSIDTWDRDFSYRGEPWRFWINNDDDTGDVSRGYSDDMPGSGTPDWANPGVDGLRDGVDFFPVLLDLQKILQVISDLSGVEVILRHPDEAVAFTYSNLLPEEVSLVHSKRLDSGFGPGMAEPFASATTLPVSSTGVSLAGDFLQNLQRENRGVLFLEGIRATSEPLVMELIHDGKVVLTSTFPLSISPVDDMFRIINLRNADPHFSATDPGPWTTHTGMPPNLPDSYLKSLTPPLRTLVHVHGFNWGGDEIPAAHSELFKRLFQAGSNARYIGIIWYGDRGSSDLTGTSLEYNENVINAFITAGLMTEALAPFAGPLTFALAHSLGNMVTSSAIADYGLQLGHYFMLSAAVPLEAYVGETEDRRHMVHPDWKDEVGLIPDYAERLLSTNWHRLFPDSDNRSLLKWKSRFAGVFANTPCTNFYSTGEEILKTGNGDLPGLFGDIFEQELIWVYNEMVKGTSTVTAALSTDLHGGWGFNRYFMEWVDPGGAAHPPAGDWQPISPSKADLIDSSELVAEPFFRPFAEDDSEFPAWGDSSWLYGATEPANSHLPPVPFAGAQRDQILNHAKILAEAIPAHSAPTGSQPISLIYRQGNINMDEECRDPGHWPVREDAEKRDRWLHSDYLNPAFSFVFNLYRKCVEHINYMP